MPQGNRAIIAQRIAQGFSKSDLLQFAFNPASLYDQTAGNTLIATSSVTFSEQTIHAYETCTSLQIQCFSYAYDPNGNITRIEDNFPTDAAKTVDYTYDALNRLVSAQSSHAASGENFTETYSYDAIGNIVSGPRGTYVYEGNQGSSYANPHAVTSITNGSSTTSFIYDKNGNMTSGGDWTYGWDYKNRLISAGNGIATTTFAYGYDDQRIKKTSGGVDTIYVSKFYEVSGATTTVYIWAGDTLVATVLGNDTTYAHTDHLNSVAVTTDENGNIKSVKDFYPYGAERISSGESISRTFIGQISDTETDLQYLNARYYDSARGQFISQDPVFWGQQNLSDPQSLNSYSYANGNPIRYSDPNGRSAADVAIGLLNAFNSNAAFGTGRISAGNYGGNRADYARGQAMGDLASMVIGTAQALGGGSIAAGGGAATVGSAGTLSFVGVPAIAIGSTVAVYGGTNVSQGAYNFFKDAKDGFGGSGGGQGDIKPGGLGGKEAADAANELGFTQKVKPGSVGIDTHGKPLFKNPETGQHLSPDRNGHNGGMWKAFDSKGNIIGTYDGSLNKIK